MKNIFRQGIRAVCQQFPTEQITENHFSVSNRSNWCCCETFHLRLLFWLFVPLIVRHFANDVCLRSTSRLCTFCYRRAHCRTWKVSLSLKPLETIWLPTDIISKEHLTSNLTLDWISLLASTLKVYQGFHLRLVLLWEQL